MVIIIAIVIPFVLFWSIQSIPQTMAPTIDDVTEALDAGEVESAFNMLTQIKSADPGNVELDYLLAVTDGMRGRDEDALHRIEALSNFADDPHLQLMAGQFALRGHLLNAARTYLKESIRLAPQQTEAIRLLANLYSNLRQPNRARAYLSMIDSLGQITAQDVFLYCVGDRARFELDVNAEQLESAFRKTPDSPAVIYALWDNYIALNRINDARTLLQDASHLKGSPEFWMILLARAETALMDRDGAKAIELLDQLHPAANEIPRTWLARGRAYRSQQRIDEARVSFRNASILDPFDPEGVFMLSQLLQDSDPSEAERLLERARDLQALNVQVESVVTMESLEEAVERFPGITQQLFDLGARREALLCLRWLERSGYKFKSMQGLAEELERSSSLIATALIVPSVDDIAPLPSSESIASDSPQVREAPSQGSVQVRFEDVTTEMGLDFSYVCDENTHTTVLTSLGGGAGAIDFDLDGVIDLFFPQGGPLPNASDRSSDVDRLYRNLGQQFQDVTPNSGWSSNDYGHGVAVGDINNDGFPDLIVANFGRNSVYVNNGDGTFDEIADQAGIDDDGWSASAALADLDDDGDLDLYVVNYLSIQVDNMVPCSDDRETPCGPLFIPGQQDRLFENLGDGAFADRTEAAGIEVPDGKGLGVVIADFDRDGSEDIFVGNDTTSNRLYMNEPAQTGLHFVERALPAGVGFGGDGKAEACMGIACGDLDGNGWFDIFVSNFEGETNTLYKNVGRAEFVDRTEEYGLAHNSYQVMGWGAQFLDVDSDGQLDLIVVNGHLHNRRMLAQAFLQSAQGFDDVSLSAGEFFSQDHMGRGLALADINRDRIPDLVVTERSGPPILLRNDTPAGARLAIQLVGRESNRDATGARVSLEFGNRKLARDLYGGGGYLCANEHKLFFTLGDEPVKTIKRIRVEWPSGHADEFTDVPWDSEFIVVESDPRLRRVP